MSKILNVRIRDVAVFLKGRKPLATFGTPIDGALPYVLIENFDGSYTTFTNDPACVRCDPDDTLIVADGANCGLVSTNHRGYIGSTLGALRPNKTRVAPRYLFYFVRSSFNILNTRTRGAAVPHLERDLMLDLEFALPPIPEQERIVRILDEAEVLRCFRAQADERTATLIPALFHQMFGAPATNPFAWPVESVGALFDRKRNGAKCGPFGSALKKHEYIDNGVPLWGIPNVLPNQFVETGSLFISPSKFEELRAYAVEPGDLLISRAGTVGRICVARPKAKDSIIGTNLIRVALDRKRVVPDFFSTLMTHFASEVGGLRANTDEGAYSFMNTTVLETLRIYLPPFRLQEDFATRVAEIRALEAGQTTSRKRLGELFQSLLHRAFRGEL